MLRATLTVDGPVAEATAQSISPESGRDLPRTRSAVGFQGDVTEISIETTDTSAMRAALNSYLECIIVVQNVDHIAKVRL